MKTVGTRAEVWHGTAKKTSGGLMKKDLKMNKRGRIVSLKMSNRAKKEKRLEKAGYKTKKGKFKLFKKKKGGKSACAGPMTTIKYRATKKNPEGTDIKFREGGLHCSMGMPKNHKFTKAEWKVMGKAKVGQKIKMGKHTIKITKKMKEQIRLGQTMMKWRHKGRKLKKRIKKL